MYDTPTTTLDNTISLADQMKAPAVKTHNPNDEGKPAHSVPVPLKGKPQGVAKKDTKPQVRAQKKSKRCPPPISFKVELPTLFGSSTPSLSEAPKKKFVLSEILTVQMLSTLMNNHGEYANVTAKLTAQSGCFIITGDSKTITIGYKTEKILGQGSFGQVSLLLFSLNEQRILVAAKLSTHSSSPALEREVNSMIATQDHLQVTCVNYLGCMTTPFSEEILVIEYCEQGTLAEYMQTEHFKRMSLTERTAAIILPLVNIVASLSHNPMIQFAHRDLTPRNILLTANMRLKLSDFGCAAIIKDGKVTMPGSAGMIDIWPPKPSSKEYKASETAQTLTAADAFALGLILKETLGLKLPNADLLAKFREVERKVASQPGTTNDSSVAKEFLHQEWSETFDETAYLEHCKASLEAISCQSLDKKDLLLLTKLNGIANDLLHPNVDKRLSAQAALLAIRNLLSTDIKLSLEPKEKEEVHQSPGCNTSLPILRSVSAF